MEPLLYAALGVLLGVLAAAAITRVRRTARRPRTTLRRWRRTRLTVTQTPRKTRPRKGARR
ncbi:hypothetical protein KGD83_21795 [Nocardiopsis akebiae]|uniref:Uncharacterized protein n=1 Tax=Nocardiopsis akebiae TaxID=2831968 RepID=A0ABX8C0P6_9ACTN|nr:hypothetical protein [Nocardiopsis akebiae]QUX27888.1 hypothetical protein KGD83_21795 [Nocardiopsis akebiae]